MATFIAIKRWMTNQPDQKALKRRKDVLQADAVQELLDKPVAHVDIAHTAIKNRAKHKATLMVDFSLKIVPS